MPSRLQTSFSENASLFVIRNECCLTSMLFNNWKRAISEDCVALVDWGMQLEDWEEHTPERLNEAIHTMMHLAQRLIGNTPPTSSKSAKSTRQRSRQPVLTSNAAR